jgi:hypothetical protein
MARTYPVQSNQITLSSGAEDVFSITPPTPGQILSLDTQVAQTTLTSGAGGSAAVPSFKNNTNIVAPTTFLLMGA